MKSIGIGQKAWIMSYVKGSNGITTLQAMRDLGVLRLSERIRELEEIRGRKFKRQWVKVKNRRGADCHVMRYSL